MIVQIDIDPACEIRRDDYEPDRIQVALRVAHRHSQYNRWKMHCPRRWLITMAGATYYSDEPDEDWD